MARHLGMKKDEIRTALAAFGGFEIATLAGAVLQAASERRVIVVDGEGKLAGVAALADLALAGKNEATAHVVKEVSEPGQR